MAQGRKARLIAAAIAAVAFSGAFSGAARASGMSIRTLGAQEQRLATIGYRIAAANAGTCTDPAMMSGIIAHDLSQYRPDARPAVASAFSLSDGVGVLDIIPGSGAEQAGLRVDDEILRVGGRSIEDPRVWADRSASYQRIDNFHALMSQALKAGPQRLLIRRNGQLIELRLAGRAGCGGDVKFVDSGSVNAWSDGRHVVLNSAIVQMARSNDELAFVIAHEMAHNILGHSVRSGRESNARFGLLFGAGGPRNAESQADLAAVTLMNRGGYAPEGGLSFLRTASRRFWWAISLDHPGFGSRMRTVASAIINNRLRTAAPYRWATVDSQPPVKMAMAVNRAAATPGS